MKALIAVAVISMVLVAGCTSNVRRASVPNYYLDDSDFVITGTGWAFDDGCQQGNESVGYVLAECLKPNLRCEVYVNNVRQSYGLYGLQDCDDKEIAIADVKSDVKPDFISLESNGSYYYTWRSVPRFVEVCCSYLNETSNELVRDYEVCNDVRLSAQCPIQSFLPSIRGFGDVNLTYWDLSSDGTLSVMVNNSANQSIEVEKVYANYAATYPENLPIIIPSGSMSQNVIVAGAPAGGIGGGYSLVVSVEYSMASQYLNSSGVITGTYS